MDSREIHLAILAVSLILASAVLLLSDESDGVATGNTYYVLDENGEESDYYYEGNYLPGTDLGGYANTHAFMGWRESETGTVYPAYTNLVKNNMIIKKFYAVYDERPSNILYLTPYVENDGWTINCHTGDVVMMEAALDTDYTFDERLTFKNHWYDDTDSFYTFYAPEPGTYLIDLDFNGPIMSNVSSEIAYGTFNVIVVNVAAANYDVSFSSEGSIIHTETVDPSEKVQSYTPPAREGYTFGGWYTDETFQTTFDFNTPITSDLTLYAKWVENPVIITFMVEGQVYSTLAVPKGSVGVVYTPIMVTGVFAGWYYDSAYTQKYDATRSLDGDITLYAYGVPPLIFTSEPNATANIQQVNSYGMFFFDATDSSGRYKIEWDFGDGNTSTDVIAYNTYSAPGLYTVTLKVTNTSGESSTTTYDVVYRDPAAGGGGENDLRYIVIAVICIIGGGLVIRHLL